MERLDFASYIKIVREYTREDCNRNKTDLLTDLFESYLYSLSNADFAFDPSLANKWINGTATISPKISAFYLDSREHQKELAMTINDAVIPYMSDSAMAVQKIYDLMIQDSSISEKKKKELSASYPDDEETFLCDVLCFCLSRKFVKRDKKRDQLVMRGSLSPVICDFILENEVPAPCRYFCGREREISQLHAVLEDQSKVFVYGIPGIGKSEFVKAYVQKYRSSYTNTIYLQYSGNLKRDIANMGFADDRAEDNEEVRFHKHNRFLRTLKQDSLLILDNFDATFSSEELLSVVLNYGCKIIFTTRCYFRSQTRFHLQEIAEKETLLQLIGMIYTQVFDNQLVVEQIIEVIHRHTMLVIVVGNLLEYGLHEPKYILVQLQKQRAEFDSSEEIELNKDGRLRKDTYYRYLRTLISLFDLEAEQQDLLRGLSFIPVSGIHARLFAGWMQQENMNEVHDMIECGLIQQKEGRIIVLHPMIQEVVITDLKPAITNSGVLLKSLHDLNLMHGKEIPSHNLIFQTCENIMKMIEKDDIPSYLLFIEDAFPNMEKYEYRSGMRMILNELSRILQDNTQGKAVDRALLLSYSARCTESTREAIRMNEQAIGFLKDVEVAPTRLLANLHSNLCGNYIVLGDMQQAMQHIEKSIHWMQQSNSSAFHDWLAIISRYVILLWDNGNRELAMQQLESLAGIVNELNSDECDDFATVLYHMTIMCLAMGELEKAKKYGRRSLEIYQKVFCDEPKLLEQNYRMLKEAFDQAHCQMPIIAE